MLNRLVDVVLIQDRNSVIQVDLVDKIRFEPKIEKATSGSFQPVIVEKTSSLAASRSLWKTSYSVRKRESSRTCRGVWGGGGWQRLICTGLVYEG